MKKNPPEYLDIHWQKKKILEAQQLKRELDNSKQSPLKMTPTTTNSLIKSEKEKKDEEEKLKPSPCSNCGRPGHSSISCLNPKIR